MPLHGPAHLSTDHSKRLRTQVPRPFPLAPSVSGCCRCWQPDGLPFPIQRPHQKGFDGRRNSRSSSGQSWLRWSVTFQPFFMFPYVAIVPLSCSQSPLPGSLGTLLAQSLPSLFSESVVDTWASMVDPATNSISFFSPQIPFA